MLSCRAATKLISDSLDGHLALRQHLALQLHLFSCLFCSRYRKQLRLVHETVHRFAENEKSKPFQAPNGGLSPEARNRIKFALKSREN